MQKLVIKNIKGETLGYVPYVYNNLPKKQEVRRNSNAPCDCIYRGSRKQGSFTCAFLDMKGSSDSTKRDTTKAATWRHSSDAGW